MSREVRVTLVIAALIAAGAAVIDAGLPVSGAVLLALGVAIAALYIGLVVRPAVIPRDSLLHIRLAGHLKEHALGSPVEQLLGSAFPTLHHVRLALEAAASDESLKAVIVEIAELQVGFATAQELHDLLARIRDAGKRVVAVVAGDSLRPREYLVACGAGEIVLNPDVGVLMLGIAVGNPFLKRVLDNLEVQAQILQWKEYKGAGELFSREQMSAALRESVEAVIGDWHQVLADSVARSRKFEREHARELLGSGFISARTACEKRLADRVGYAEEIRAEFDPSGKGKKVVGLGRYLRRIDYLEDTGKRARIALVYGVGPVVSGAPPQAGEFISGEQTAHAIERAAIDEKVRAIVFRVNSPGGSAVGSDLVWRAVGEARKRGKPVVVSMGDVAGSGGYYVSMGADAIVAQAATVTGSIGVIHAKFNLAKLLARVGISFDFAKTDPVSDATSISRGMTETELAQLNSVMAELYGNFTAKVADGRKLDAERAEELARGRIWSGSAAQARGLVDHLGGLTRAIELAREKAKLEPGEPHELALYPPPGPLAHLQISLRPAQEVSSAMSAVARVCGIPERWMPAMVELFSGGGALLLCPFF